MIKRMIYIKELLSLVILITYLFSFSPSVISHNHSHDEGLACEDLSEEVDLHFDCLHAEHMEEKKKECTLCDYDAFYEDAMLFNSTQFKTKIFINDTYQVSKRVCLKQKTKQSNKSPPILRLV